MDDRNITRVTHPGAGDGKAEVARLGDEDDRLLEAADEGEFVKDGEVVMDEDDRGTRGDLAESGGVDLDAKHDQDDPGGLGDDPLGETAWLIDVIGILFDEEAAEIQDQ